MLFTNLMVFAAAVSVKPFYSWCKCHIFLCLTFTRTLFVLNWRAFSQWCLISELQGNVYFFDSNVTENMWSLDNSCIPKFSNVFDLQTKFNGCLHQFLNSASRRKKKGLLESTSWLEHWTFYNFLTYTCQTDWSLTI